MARRLRRAAAALPLSFIALAGLPMTGGAEPPAEKPSTLPRAAYLRGKEAVIPFQLDGPRPIPIVEALVNDRGPYKFFFDTGASGCVFDSGFIREMGIAAGEKAQVGDPASPGAVEATRITIAKLSVGGAEWLDVPGVAFDRSRFGAAEGINGVLGLPLAAASTLTVDYGASQLSLSDDPIPEKAEGVVGFVGDGPLPEIDITVAGKPIRAHLDTGSPSGFTLPSSFVAGLKLKSDPIVIGRGRTVAGEFEIKQAQIEGAIVLAGTTFPDPQVRINDRFPIANIGREILSNFRLSLDQRNRRARFIAVGGPAQPTLKPIDPNAPARQDSAPNPASRRGR